MLLPREQQPSKAIKKVNLRQLKIRPLFSRKMFTELRDCVQTSLTKTRKSSCNEFDPMALSSILSDQKPIMADLTQLELSLSPDRENQKGNEICILREPKFLENFRLLVKAKEISFVSCYRCVVFHLELREKKLVSTYFIVEFKFLNYI